MNNGKLPKITGLLLILVSLIYITQSVMYGTSGFSLGIPFSFLGLFAGIAVIFAAVFSLKNRKWDLVLSGSVFAWFIPVSFLLMLEKVTVHYSAKEPFYILNWVTLSLVAVSIVTAFIARRKSLKNGVSGESTPPPAV